MKMRFEPKSRRNVGSIILCPSKFALKHGLGYRVEKTEELSNSFWNKQNPCVCLVSQLCPTLCNPTDCRPAVSSAHGDSSGKNARVAFYALLQQIFPTQGSNPSLLLFSQILYCLSHWGSPRIPEWVAYPFCKRVSWPRQQTWVSCIAGWFFTSWASREAQGSINGT